MIAMANFIHDSSVGSPIPSSVETDKESNVTPSLNKRFTKRSLFIKKIMNPKVFIGGIIFLLLLVGGVSAFFLSQTSQDIRQQASGCTYWNGEAAPEGAHDNRGGIRQECNGGVWDTPDDGNLDPSDIIAEQQAQDAGKPKDGCMSWDGSTVSHGSYDNRGGMRQQCSNGVWDTPDDGNLDPSGIIAEQQARDAGKPKDGCMSWDGSMVSHGSYDNRNGIRQQCVNGLWDKPDDGNLDPSGIIAEQNANRSYDGCVSWDGSDVKHGSYEDRGGIRQQCVNGLWDKPDDGIVDPRGGIDAISAAIGGLDEGEVDYADARETYDKFCRNNIESQSVNEVCDSLEDSLRESAETQRNTALTDAVNSNNDEVSYAIGGLDEGEIDYADALATYNEYCEGSKSQQTSVTVCNALETSLQTIAAETIVELVTDTVEDISNTVNYAIEALQRGIMDAESAQQTYDDNCVSAVNRASEYCQNLEELIADQETLEDTCGGLDQLPCDVYGERECNFPYILNDRGNECVSPLEEIEVVECISGTQSKFACERYGDPCEQGADGCWSPGEVQFGSSIFECFPNTCDDGNWCGEDGKPILSISCGDSESCDDGRVSEGLCDSDGYRCIGGILYANRNSCEPEDIDPLSLVNDETDVSCFTICSDRGASVNQCNEECRDFNADMIDSSIGYQTMTQCITSMEVNGVSGRCTRSGERYVFESTGDGATEAEYKSCFWWSESTTRCVEDVYLNPTFDDCGDRSSGLGNSCGDVKPEGVEDIPEEIEEFNQETAQEIMQEGLQAGADIWDSFLDSLQDYSNTMQYGQAEGAVNELYIDLAGEDCTCNGSFEREPVTVNVGVSGTGDDGKCYQCYVNARGGCGWSTSCGYSLVTEVNNDLDADFVNLQLEYPDHVFMVGDLTSEDQIEHIEYAFALMPDSLVNSENNTYMVGDAGTGGGLANQSTNIIYVGSPGDEEFHQNPDTQMGYAASLVIHETLHVLDDTQTQGFCSNEGCPTYLEAFSAAAESDGLVFESEFTDMEVEGANDFMLYSEYPTTATEGFAITGANYILAGEQLREERPNLYAFYQNTVFEGNEYIEIYNGDCETTRIEIKTEQSEATQSQMNSQCN
jgi:hypothetical protein